MYFEVLSVCSVHLIHEVEHFDIEFDMQQFANIGQGIEELTVPAFEIDRHNIALVLPRTLNKILLPF